MLASCRLVCSYLIFLPRGGYFMQGGYSLFSGYIMISHELFPERVCTYYSIFAGAVPQDVHCNCSRAQANLFLCGDLLMVVESPSRKRYLQS